MEAVDTVHFSMWTESCLKILGGYPQNLLPPYAVPYPMVKESPSELSFSSIGRVVALSQPRSS
jgi:hypothetical protein